LETADKQAYLMLITYERERRKQQRGYKAFEDPDVSTLAETPIWKTFRTISLWLKAKGCFIRLADVHWQGYVEYVFREMTPTIPMPGQLRNDMLLRKYVSAIPVMKNHATMTYAELGDLYNRILRPEFRLPGIKRYLNLDVQGLRDD
jgi:hypothetical protein